MGFGSLVLFAFVSFINNAKWKLLKCQKLRPYAVLLSASKKPVKVVLSTKHANLRHILTKKKQAERHLRPKAVVSKGDLGLVIACRAVRISR